MRRRHIEHHTESDGDDDVMLRIGAEELTIRRRYETASIFNDFLIGLWFLVGSVAFLRPSWQEFGTWLFIIGSAELLLRPMIRLAHRIHLQRLPRGRWDF